MSWVLPKVVLCEAIMTSEFAINIDPVIKG